MKHERLRKSLSEYLDGHLSGAARAQVEQHLAACGNCRAEFSKLRRTVELLRDLPRVDAPSDLSDRVVARLRAGAGRPGWVTRSAEALTRFTDSQWLAPLTAAALGLGVLLALQDIRVTWFLPNAAPERTVSASSRWIEQPHSPRPGPTLEVAHLAWTPTTTRRSTAFAPLSCVPSVAVASRCLPSFAEDEAESVRWHAASIGFAKPAAPCSSWRARPTGSLPVGSTLLGLGADLESRLTAHTHRAAIAEVWCPR